MKRLIGLLVALVILDGLITHYLVDWGLATEGNPILEPLVGAAGFMIIKVVGALFCALILWDISRHFPKVAWYATWFFVIAYSAIVVWNSSLFILR